MDPLDDPQEPHRFPKAEVLLRQCREDQLDALDDMQSSADISPLHRQRVKGRAVIVTEDPKLYLVWFYDHIFIKPLPGFWNLSGPNRLDTSDLCSQPDFRSASSCNSSPKSV